MEMYDYLTKNFVIIGHRGLPEKYPENTEISFKNAFNYTDAVELDVHLSADGGVYIVHDFNLKRLTGNDINIENLNSSEIDRLNIKGFKIPRLDYILKTYHEKYFFIELKTIDDSGSMVYNNIVTKTLEIIKNTGMKDHVCVISFNPFSLREMHALDDSIMLGLDYCDLSEKYMGKLNSVDLRELGISVYIPEYKNDKIDCLIKLRSLGFIVIPWTVDNYVDAVKIKNADLNGIITNRADVMASMLKL
ncbi:glycerophosphodiester phosphodiesterase [Acidiplasma sp.]|uniref:glycerophosphodiester phosphodiesterase n=1 Tax=Acidiplasma sp. TaxID=1872114 RepID=UPI0025873593|nr:glycerophosphodiester phosphodiesterase [Acidiplasma sp.]